MKTSYIFYVFGIALVFIVLVFALTAAANFNQLRGSTQNLSAAAFSRQITTPTPPTENVSVVGSTDGIVIMGVVLVIVVTMPVLFRKKRKKQA